MKTLIFLLLMAPMLLFAQSQKTSESKDKNKLQYSCRELEATPDGKLTTLRKDVAIETADLTVRGDSAISYDGQQTWAVYGVKKMVFNRQFVAQEMSSNTVQYKVGAKTIYMRNKTVYLE